MKPRRKKTTKTKNKSKDLKQQKQLKELAYQVQRFVNLKLNPPESAEHIPPALSPRPKSAKEGYLDAASALTLIPEDVPLRPASNEQMPSTPTEPPLK
jgi:hypothetical protein